MKAEWNFTHMKEVIESYKKGKGNQILIQGTEEDSSIELGINEIDSLIVQLQTLKSEFHQYQAEKEAHRNRGNKERETLEFIFTHYNEKNPIFHEYMTIPQSEEWIPKLFAQHGIKDVPFTLEEGENYDKDSWMVERVELLTIPTHNIKVLVQLEEHVLYNLHERDEYYYSLFFKPIKEEN